MASDPRIAALATAYPGLAWTRRRIEAKVTTYFTGRTPSGWKLVRVKVCDIDALAEARLLMPGIGPHPDYARDPVEAVGTGMQTWRFYVLAGLRDLDAAAGGGAS